MATAGMTGANFAVAETGAVVTVTNEGNADRSGNAPELRICSVGLEKTIPKSEHLAVFIRLLTRSATGMAITQYTSHFRANRPLPTIRFCVRRIALWHRISRGQPRKRERGYSTRLSPTFARFWRAVRST
jgi:hypothetical protein